MTQSCVCVWVNVPLTESVIKVGRTPKTRSGRRRKRRRRRSKPTELVEEGTRRRAERRKNKQVRS